MKKKIVIGGKYFKLLVLSKSNVTDKTKSTFYECLCDCGNHKAIRGSHLNNGETKSCGCHKLKAPGTAAFRKLFRSTKNGAKYRNIEFLLAQSQHDQLIVQSCHYCGAPPAKYNPYTNILGQAYEHNKTIREFSILRATIFVNGIDRVDNSVGYVLENCVPCCSKCNHGKSDDTVDDFIEHAYALVAYQEKLKLNKIA